MTALVDQAQHHAQHTTRLWLGEYEHYPEKKKNLSLIMVKVIWTMGNLLYVCTGAYEPPEGRRRSVPLRVLCVRRSSLAVTDIIWSGQLQGISIG